MEPTDLTVHILREIRDEIRNTNSRLDQTNSRLDQANSRLDQTISRLEEVRSELAPRLVETEIRLATAITGFQGTMGQIRELLETRLNLNDRVARCETDIAVLQQRVGGARS